MGCCVSSEASSISKKDELVNVGSNGSSKVKAFSHESRAPPPSAEEETVKEVLSETPKPKPKPQPTPCPKPDPDFTANVEQVVQENNFFNQNPAVFTKIQENHQLEQLKHKNVAKKQELNNVNEENMSEVSEVCSLSFSESVSTTTNITDRRDNEEDQEVMQQKRMRNNSSPAKFTPQRNQDFRVRKDRVVTQSPTRRFEQSPGKRNPTGSVRLVQSGREEPGRVPNQSIGIKSRDTGESSGRRSRSPAATRSAAIGRSPSTRRTIQSPGRTKNESGQNGSHKHNNSRKIESPGKTENRWPNNDQNNNSSTNESLENPHVSLECFIFL